MVDDYVLNKVLDKIREKISIEHKILIDTDDKLPEDNTSKNVILMTYVIKGNDKFYPQIFLEA